MQMIRNSDFNMLAKLRGRNCASEFLMLKKNLLFQINTDHYQMDLLFVCLCVFFKENEDEVQGEGVSGPQR